MQIILNQKLHKEDNCRTLDLYIVGTILEYVKSCVSREGQVVVHVNQELKQCKT